MNVKIEKLVYGGDGLGHADGKTVFVPFVLPGEVVSIRPVQQKKKFVRGRVQHVVTPSADRTTPTCRHYTVCGGCHYQHLGDQAQVDIDRKSTRLNSSHIQKSRMPSSA